jgi:CRP-like cAMP-binding protein
MTKTMVGFLPHETLRAFMRDHPRISDVLWRDTLIEASIFREWMVGLGTRSAYTRMAHFFCELMIKQRAVHLVDEDATELPMPLSQAEMGEALGLTPVHVNRTLKVLRDQGLISGGRGTITIRDWHGLKEAGEFDRTYLHLRSKVLQ